MSLRSQCVSQTKSAELKQGRHVLEIRGVEPRKNSAGVGTGGFEFQTAMYTAVSSCRTFNHLESYSSLLEIEVVLGTSKAAWGWGQGGAATRFLCCEACVKCSVWRGSRAPVEIEAPAQESSCGRC